LALARDLDWKLYLDGERPILEQTERAVRRGKGTGEKAQQQRQKAQQRLAGRLTAAKELRQRLSDESLGTIRMLQQLGYIE
jgi:hypothetical protein